MQEHHAIQAFAALAQEHRLKVFRLLVQQAPQGLAAGQIAVQVGVPASTMSSHLAHLERAGLIRSWREQRHIIYATHTEGIRHLLTFLTEECCGGHPELCGYGSQSTQEGERVAGVCSLPPLTRRENMPDCLFHVLFLCTGNSARSIMAEAVMNHLAPDKFKAYSAGSHPKGTVHPYALDVLQTYRYPTDHLHSKSWDEFTSPTAPLLDFVFTLCDDAANEVCPVWPGAPLIEHWGLPDPAAVAGSEAVKRFAFVDTLRMLTRRIEIFADLPIAALRRLTPP